MQLEQLKSKYKLGQFLQGKVEFHTPFGVFLDIDDPLKLTIGGHSLYVDLGAEKLIAAQKDSREIAVEIKSFLSPSPIKDLENALGQYVLYQNILKSTDAKRTLYLAIREEVYNDLFSEPIGQLLLSNKQIKLIIFNSDKQELVEWIN